MHQSSPQPLTAHEETRSAWNTNAAFWDERMGEGNDFVNVLIWPAVQRLLDIQPGARVLDIACGNGLTARRLADLGATVVASDFAETMIDHARQRSAGYSARITYQVLDATDEAALTALGGKPFDAALCSMALFDMAEIDPLFRALAQLLRPGGSFVFSLMHPCFNNPFTTHSAETSNGKGGSTTRYAVKVYGYMTAATAHGTALRNQPQPHIYFHRALSTLLESGFCAGFVVDGLEERAFPPGDDPAANQPLSWSSAYSEIPPVMVVRMRRS
ncbi:MAG: class I SAM-dependent methyltransferase [Anaerolineales bacterium]|nr:class I SAM-dependent methyltransferase [Anaerolineales bacterium]